MASKIRRVVGPRKLVFDLASGFGRRSADLDEPCVYRGIDLNETFVEHGRKLGRDSWLQDAVDGPEYPRSDVVITTDLLHHITDEQIRTVLRRSLDAAPVVIVVEPSFLGWVHGTSAARRLLRWVFATLDNDGINPRHNWRSKEEYLRHFHDLFGLGHQVAQVETSVIGMNVVAVIERREADPQPVTAATGRAGTPLAS